jgi:hypothetical protein
MDTAHTITDIMGIITVLTVLITTIILTIMTGMKVMEEELAEILELGQMTTQIYPLLAEEAACKTTRREEMLTRLPEELRMAI